MHVTSTSGRRFHRSERSIAQRMLRGAGAEGFRERTRGSWRQMLARLTQMAEASTRPNPSHVGGNEPQGGHITRNTRSQSKHVDGHEEHAEGGETDKPGRRHAEQGRAHP